MGFLSLFKKRTSSYYGKEAYKHVDKLLNSERKVLIVSPYIDDYYASYLVERSPGRSFHIISSSISGVAAKKLSRTGLGNALTSTFLSISVNWLILLLGHFNPYLAFTTIGAGMLLVAYSLVHRNSIYLKIPKNFVHAKMYIGDKMAIEGSANQSTYAGMHKNIESIRVISDQKEINELKHSFWALWNSS